MTLSDTREESQPMTTGRRMLRLERWFDPGIMLLLAALTLVTRLINIEEYPGTNIDEGFYVSQAWSLITHGTLAPFGYQFDHLPLGWILMAGWFILTGALGDHENFVIFAGREFAVFMAAFVAPLLYLSARRLGLRRSFAIVACLLWVLSPLAINFSRMALLDNFAVPWVLASLALVLSPRPRLLTAVGSGLCFAMAILTKEIMWLAVIGLAFTAFWQYRKVSQSAGKLFSSWLGAVVAGYLVAPIWALLAGEIDAFWSGQFEYQLLGRQSKGSIFDSGSQAYAIVHEQWLSIDWWLPMAGVAAVLPALFIARLRGPALIVAVHVVVVLLPFRFLPTAFVVIMLPFMALLVAGVLDALWPEKALIGGTARQRVRAGLGIAATVVLLAGFTFGGGATSWQNTYDYQMSAQENIYQRQAIDWVHQNLRQDDVVVTEYHLWLDVVTQGLAEQNIANAYKFNNEWDDAKRASVTYLVLSTYSMPGRGPADSLLTQLAQRSEPVLVFGQDGDYRQMFILKVPPQ